MYQHKEEYKQPRYKGEQDRHYYGDEEVGRRTGRAPLYLGGGTAHPSRIADHLELAGAGLGWVELGAPPSRQCNSYSCSYIPAAPAKLWAWLTAILPLRLPLHKHHCAHPWQPAYREYERHYKGGDGYEQEPYHHTTGRATATASTRATGTTPSTCHVMPRATPSCPAPSPGSGPSSGRPTCA